MNSTRTISTLGLLTALALITSSAQGNLVYFEDFDGNTNGYNASSTTAVAAGDWVDFANRITTNFSGFEGYTTASGGTETVLTGGNNSGDPQIRADFGFGIPKNLVTEVALRLRIDVDGNQMYDDALTLGNLSVFWGTDQYVHPGAQNGNTQLNFNLNTGNTVGLTAQADGWHLVTWDIADGGLTAGTGTDLDSIRIDPGNALNGNSFEIDYFSISAIPEPNVACLMGIGLVAARLVRRRR